MRRPMERCEVDITKLRGVLYGIILPYEPFLSEWFIKERIR